MLFMHGLCRRRKLGVREGPHGYRNELWLARRLPENTGTTIGAKVKSNIETTIGLACVAAGFAFH
jgi:hypothetical protein